MSSSASKAVEPCKTSLECLPEEILLRIFKDVAVCDLLGVEKLGGKLQRLVKDKVICRRVLIWTCKPAEKGRKKREAKKPSELRKVLPWLKKDTVAITFDRQLPKVSMEII